MTGFLAQALASSGVAETPEILQAGQDSPFALPFFFLFVIGNRLGPAELKTGSEQFCAVQLRGELAVEREQRSRGRPLCAEREIHIDDGQLRM